MLNAPASVLTPRISTLHVSRQTPEHQLGMSRPISGTDIDHAWKV